jgi:hypothetical protein
VVKKNKKISKLLHLRTASHGLSAIFALAPSVASVVRPLKRNSKNFGEKIRIINQNFWEKIEIFGKKSKFLGKNRKNNPKAERLGCRDYVVKLKLREAQTLLMEAIL